MSYNDPSGIRLMYEGVATDEEEKQEGGAARAPDRQQDIEPTLIRGAVEEGVEPLSHNNVVDDTILPIQASGSADLFAAVDGPAYKGQLMDATQPYVTSLLPILNKQLKSDNPHEDASLLKGAGDGEAVMIAAHYFGNDGTNANLEGQAAVLDGKVYDADAFALTGGYFVKRRCIIAIVGLFVLAAVVVGGVCGSEKCSSSPGFVPTASPTTLAPTTMVPSLVPSSMPTVSNTSSAMIWFINSVTLSGHFATYPIPPDSSGSATSEERALAWLIQEDPLKLSAENESDQNRLVQRFALLTLWYSLNGEAWVKNDGWLVTDDECSWYGIACINDQVTTVGTTEVSVGVWSQNNLSGTIPADVALLTSVTQINLGGNQKITGSLLPSIADLNILQSFNAASCGLSGSLPEAIGEGWSKITDFQIQDNAFIGSLPPSLGNWTDLYYLDVQRNHLTGSLSETFGAWSKLEYFSLNENSFTGALPSSIVNWNLLQLDMSDNTFSGSLPENIGNWGKLQFFLVDNNSFTGTLPNSMAKWNNLLGIFMGDNYFTGTLPDGLEAWSSVINFSLRNTNMTGTLPETIGRWVQLHGFDVTSNNFVSTLPASIGNWSDIEIFVVEYNNLTGTLPKEITMWSRLKRLNVRGNQITGTLPNGIGQCTALEELVLHTNLFTGPLPESISELTALTWFDAFENRFSGPLPTSIDQWTKIETFRIYDNAFRGTLPDSLSQWTAISDFEIEMNAFSGTLPAIIGSSWTQMDTFTVNENMLSGTIPSSVGNWSKVRFFWIADNLFNRTLPDTIGEWKALESFDASRNVFTGTLPQSIGQWTDLAGFSISGCQSLTGSIPQGTAQWQNLHVAYFNDTALVGSIPDELCGVVNLTDLAADCISEVACACCTACY